MIRSQGEVMSGISARMPYEKKFVEVNGRRMAYVDEGTGLSLIHI